MTAKEVLEAVASMTARFSDGERSEIREALAEADAEFNRGEGVDGDELRRQLALR